MTRRTRSILVDSTIGKIFYNTSSTGTVANLIAGTKISNKGFTSGKKTILKITSNLSGSLLGLQFPGDSLVTEVKITLATAPTGQAVILKVRTGPTSDNTTDAATFTIPIGSKTLTIPTSISVSAGEGIFIDVLQIGTGTSAGKGLNVTFYYYG